jgi:hypothetical protein
MARFFRLLLAVLLGLVVGSVINMGLIMVSGKLIPPPAGANVATMEGLKASMHLFEAKHFVFPFLAHALGTFAGAFVAGVLAPGRSIVPAAIVGGLFLLGGVTNVFMLPAPAWFGAADLLLAYLPTAWLGQALAARWRVGRVSGA